MLNNYKPAIKNGVYLALVSLFVFLIIYVIDPAFSATTKGFFLNIFVSLLAGPILFMVIGARDCKPNFNFFNFGKAFMAAAIVGVVAVVIGSAFQLVFTELIDPGYEQMIYDEVMLNTESALEESNMDQETIDMYMQQTKDRMEAGFSIAGKIKQFGYFIAWYLIIALIVAAVQKEKEPKDLIA